MPGGDGKGPLGKGSRTGRGMGNCQPDSANNSAGFGVGRGGRPRGGGRGRAFGGGQGPIQQPTQQTDNEQKIKDLEKRIKDLEEEKK